MRVKLGKKFFAWILCLAMVFTSMNFPTATMKVEAEETDTIVEETNVIEEETDTVVEETNAIEEENNTIVEETNGQDDEDGDSLASNEEETSIVEEETIDQDNEDIATVDVDELTDELDEEAITTFALRASTMSLMSTNGSGIVEGTNRQYIKNISTSGGDGWTMLNFNNRGNLNRDADGSTMHAYATFTDDPEDAITMLWLKTSSSLTTITYNGKTYNVTKATGNMNSGGDARYLYYTKDKEAGDPIASVGVWNNHDNYFEYVTNTGRELNEYYNTSWEKFINTFGYERIDGDGRDINSGKGSKSATIYMFFKRAPYVNAYEKIYSHDGGPYNPDIVVSEGTKLELEGADISDVGEYIISYRASKEGEIPIEGSVKVRIIIGELDRVMEGDGTLQNPLKISTAYQLERFRDRVNKGEYGLCAELTADIDLSVVCGEELEISWDSIGKYKKDYTGTFDGKGHRITGLYINNDSEMYQGLFGHTDRATIQNLEVEGNITAKKTYAATIVSYANNSTIKNCVSRGNVQGDSYVGGIAGNGSGSEIISCQNYANLHGRDYIGGILGNYANRVSNCLNAGIITMTEEPSYIDKHVNTIGRNINNLENCLNIAKPGAKVTENATYYCYSDGTGNVTKEQLESGEVAYLLNGEKTDDSSAWGQTLTGDDKQSYPVPNGAKVYKTEPCISYTNNANEVNKEHVDANGDYICDECEANLITLKGEGTKESPYQISNASQLSEFRNLVKVGKTDICAELTTDIDLSTVCSEERKTSWFPIGTETKKYCGTFDGKGHRITGLYINVIAVYRGLFGYVESATIQNLEVEGNVTNDDDWTAIIVGNALKSTINNCVSRGSVQGNSYVGGIVGNGRLTEITSCQNYASINGRNCLGGIVGSYVSKVSNCLNAGVITWNGKDSSKAIYTIGDRVANLENCLNITKQEEYVTENADYYYYSDETGNVTKEELESGEVAYLLNGEKTDADSVWGQTLTGADKQSHPVPNGEKVYKTAPCTGYTNDAEKVNREHADADKDEICDACGFNLHIHSGVKVEQLDATCAAYGVKEYYKCSCGRYYIDSECKEEIENFEAWKNGEGKIAKLPHNFFNEETGKYQTTCVECGEENPNKCGDKVYYVYNAENKELFIYGEGAMEDNNTPLLYSSGLSNVIEKVVIEDGVTTIRDYSFFRYYNNLLSVEIPDSVTSIGKYAFYNCGRLSSIEIPDSVTSIGEFAFGFCDSLSSINIPDLVTDIGEYAFADCESIEKIVLPESLRFLGAGAFDGCSNLSDIVIPNSLVSFEVNTFKGTLWLNNKVKENPLVIVNNTLIYAGLSEGQTTVTIPKSVRVINECAFDYNIYLEKVEFEEGSQLEVIGDGAFFSDSNLKEIQIPKTVKSIGEWVFAFCDNPELVVEIPCGVQEVGEELLGLIEWYDGEYHGFCGTVKVVEGSAADFAIRKDYAEYIEEGQFTFDRTGEHDFHLLSKKCSICGATKFVDKFVKIQAYLNEQIALDYKVNISESYIDKAEKMEFNVAGVKQYVSIENAKKETVDGVECYVFRCVLNSTQMEDKIIAKMIYSDGTSGEVKAYSLKKYMDTLREKYSDDGEIMRLVDSMETFGECMKAYATNSFDKMPTVTLTEKEQEYIDDYKIDATGIDLTDTIKTIKSSSARANMGSLMSVSVKYVCDEEADYQFFVDGEQVEAVKTTDNDGKVYYEVKSHNIAPLDYYKTIKFTVKLDGIEENYVYSPLRYVKKALNYYSTNADYVSLFNSIVKYHYAVLYYETK